MHGYIGYSLDVIAASQSHKLSPLSPAKTLPLRSAHADVVKPERLNPHPCPLLGQPRGPVYIALPPRVESVNTVTRVVQ